MGKVTINSITVSGAPEISRRLKKQLDKLKPAEQRRIYKQASMNIKAAARENVGKSKKPHHRYENGRIVATYYPGNLQRAIRHMTFRRSKTAVFVGAKYGKGSAQDNDTGPVQYKGAKIDGWYMRFVEFGANNRNDAFRPGTAPLGRAYRSEWRSTLASITKAIKRKFDR